MDGFSYLSVMVSIVLGLGLTQLFAGIGNLVQIRRRVRLYWLHSLWVLLLIVLHLHMWWSFWALRGVADWTYAIFVYVLIGPGALVIASHIIIPELIDNRIDIERHYFDTSPLFFGILTVAAAWAMFLEPIMGLRAFFVPFRILQVIAVATFASCSASKDRRLHAAAITLIVLLLVIGITIDRVSLGQFKLRQGLRRHGASQSGYPERSIASAASVPLW
ncbi:MAG TPA: hypothetical protein VGV60_12520 [Candidatus Polarisedimenticolia bacterium]|jgi:hypothetical protein|nr:hypothetical protein [Candidatus Polarisedimenticolia bacterium]